MKKKKKKKYIFLYVERERERERPISSKQEELKAPLKEAPLGLHFVLPSPFSPAKQKKLSQTKLNQTRPNPFISHFVCGEKESSQKPLGVCSDSDSALSVSLKPSRTIMEEVIKLPYCYPEYGIISTFSTCPIKSWILVILWPHRWDFLLSGLQNSMVAARVKCLV